jgi:glutaminyl-tRNA synthetase
VLSKRKLIQLVDENHVDGWDDPRLPTMVGARRRGYTPEAIRLFADRIGVSPSRIPDRDDVLEDCLRKDLDERAPRRIAVLDPLKLVIDNYPEGTFENLRGAQPSAAAGTRQAPFPFAASSGSSARTSSRRRPRATSASSPATWSGCATASSSTCTGCDKDAAGNITAVHCKVLARLEVRHAGADNYKVKGNIHWVSARHALDAGAALRPPVHRPRPGAGDTDFLTHINPDSVRMPRATRAFLQATPKPEDRFQFERHGYFVADREGFEARRAGVQPGGDARQRNAP